MLKDDGKGLQNEHRTFILIVAQFRSMLELLDPLPIKLKRRQELRTAEVKNETFNTAAFLIWIRLKKENIDENRSQKFRFSVSDAAGLARFQEYSFLLNICWPKSAGIVC